MFGINYIKLSIWSSIYYFQEEKSDIIFKIILKNIKECGCVAIKFTQWLLPKIEAIYDIDIQGEDYKWFNDLEDIYENCNVHDIKYTEKIYKKSFGTPLFKDYEVLNVIASGSMGQVYKIKDDNTIYAMKVLHPDVESDLLFIKTLVNIIYYIPYLGSLLRYYVPLDINDFIKDFRIQSNLINEANNCLAFYNIYKNNDIIIIPTIYKVSKDIIIMSYEEGESFDKCDLSDYNRYKAIALNKLFVKNNEYTHGLMHGDLHKGNWKIREENDLLKLIIYDFGFCWRLPDFLVDHIQFIDKSFIYPDKNIDDFIKSCWIFCENKTSIENVKEWVMEIKNENKDMDYDDPILLLKLIIKSCRIGGYLINSFILQSLIIHTQLCGNYEKYGVTARKDENDDYYSRKIYDLINICDTYQICEGYSSLLKSECEKKEDLFESIENVNQFSKYPLLKKLALNES
tara:strand:+ start:820 stop:2190 length:1371 start_codon:yes stop_codon:yes gene_type:complete